MQPRPTMAAAVGAVPAVGPGVHRPLARTAPALLMLQRTAAGAAAVRAGVSENRAAGGLAAHPVVADLRVSEAFLPPSQTAPAYLRKTCIAKGKYRSSERMCGEFEAGRA